MNNFEKYNLSSSIDENINLIKEIFEGDDTLKSRIVQNQHNPLINCAIVFIDGMADSKIINHNIIKPITTSVIEYLDLNPIDYLTKQVILSSEYDKTSDLFIIVSALINGDTILFLEGYQEGIIVSSKGWETRSITEPTVERVLRGPREGFTESLTTNLSLIRRKVRSKDLKFKFMTLGSITQTKLCITYIEGLAREEILSDLYQQISAINIDGALDVKYIQEYIDENPFSIFETSYNTEKPDTVAAKLLEGRVAILLDGTPVVATLPFLFVELFQSADDYYINYYYASLNRMLRLLGFFLTISIPAMYLSFVTYHQEIIPTPLIMSIYAARQGVPLPTVISLVALLIVFEILREAGTRMPSYIGQALSIVGALVLGTAAVEPRFVSAPIVIVVGMSGITSLITPTLGGASVIIKLAFVLLSSILGLYGYVLGMAFLLIHLLKLKSFGIPYMTSLTTFNMEAIKDTSIRTPRWYMKFRPKYLGAKDPLRGNGGKNHE